MHNNATGKCIAMQAKWVHNNASKECSWQCYIGAQGTASEVLKRSAIKCIFYASMGAFSMQSWKAYSMQYWRHISCLRQAYSMQHWKLSIFYAESKASIFYAWIITMRGTHATKVYMKVRILCNRGALNMYSGASDLPLRGLCNTLCSKRGHLVYIGER